VTVVNHLSFITNTAGTGAITSAGPAIIGYLDLPNVTPGTTISYGILDGGNSFEYGSGLWNGTAMARAPSTSSSGTVAINLSGGSSLVFSVPIASDFSSSSGTGGGSNATLSGSNAFTGPNSFSGGLVATGTASITLGSSLTAGSALTLSGSVTLTSGSMFFTTGGSQIGFYFGAIGRNAPTFVPSSNGSLFLCSNGGTGFTLWAYVNGNWFSIA
jgi:hypothetical protein